MLKLYKNLGKLGEGGFGTVYLLEHMVSNHKVAAKFMNISEYLRKADQVEKALKESTSLISLDHSQIITFESSFLLKSELIIFTEYMPGGELGQYVQKNTVTEDLAKKIFKLLLEPVYY